MCDCFLHYVPSRFHGWVQPVEKGHRKVAFFSYRGRKCGIMVWGDKNVGEECRKSRAA